MIITLWLSIRQNNVLVTEINYKSTYLEFTLNMHFPCLIYLPYIKRIMYHICIVICHPSICRRSQKALSSVIITFTISHLQMSQDLGLLKRSHNFTGKGVTQCAKHTALLESRKICKFSCIWKEESPIAHLCI